MEPPKDRELGRQRPSVLEARHETGEQEQEINVYCFKPLTF